MSALDILPPNAPMEASEKKGFLSRLFRKKEDVPMAPPKEEISTFGGSLEDGVFDLNDIRRRAGLEEPVPEEPAEEPAELPPAPLPEMAEKALPELPQTGTQAGIDDWTFDAEPAAAPKEDSYAEPAEPPKPDTEWTDEKGQWDVEPEATKPAPSDWAAPVETDPQERQEPSFADEPAEMPEPVEEVKPEEVSHIAKPHLEDLDAEHRDLENELQSMLKEPMPALPAPEHPLEKPVPEGQEFILKNGQPLRSLRELIDVIESIDQESFFHHVNAERNDFANWLLHVFHEETLAKEILRAKSRKQIMRILKSHADAADKAHRESGKRIDKTLKSRTEKIERITKLDTRLAELKAELTKRSTSLADEKQLLSGNVEKRIAAEVAKRVKVERKAIEKLQKEFEHEREEHERAFHASSTAVEKREAKLVERADEAKRLEAALKEDRARFAAERAAALPILQQAKAVEERMRGVAAERTRLEEERKLLLAERERLTTEKRAAALKEANAVRREKAAVAMRDDFAGREKGLMEAEEDLRRRQQEFASLKIDFERREKEAHELEKKMMARIKGEQKAAEEKERKAVAAEEKVTAQLRERRKIAKYIDDAEKSLTQHEQSLETLPAYLSEKLQGIKGGIAPPPPASVKNLRIYSMIDKAREALERDELSEARELYAKIRDSFNRESLSSTEKSVLYTTIRELYDDIHLASLK